MGATPPLPDDPEERLLRRLRAAVMPLDLLNPIAPCIQLGVGVGTLPASFGAELAPEMDYSVRRPLDVRSLLDRGMPDPERSGLIPVMREEIAAALQRTPDWLRIAPPDMQGPFNIAHALLGDEAFLLPVSEPGAFHDFMSAITDFWLALHDNLRTWIGPARYPPFPKWTCRITECSANLVSEQFYVEHVLPHDRKIAERLGAVGIHPCSGPHVYRVTLRELPNVIYTEAGNVEKTAAGAISVPEALREIGDRPIILVIGQELPPGQEEAFIRRDLDLARDNPRLTFGYTGMHWRKSDEELIRELHRRLDDYWQETTARA
jgi:hypothetical protein